MNVEEVFSSFVRSAGGELVSDLLPRSPEFDNADYLFRKQHPEPVVAELKCLTKDLLKEGYQEKVDRLFSDWMNRRLIGPFWGRQRFSSRDLPSECQHELFSLLGTPIKKCIAKANKQIKQTKAHFGLNDAKGLLLLVNDGNYSLESDVVLFLMDKALGKEHSGINSVVYFTVNMTARMPGFNSEVAIWVDGGRNGVPGVSRGFLDWLQNGWVNFCGKIIGQPIPTFTTDDHQVIEQIRFIHPPEPRQYYRTRNKAAVNLRREIAKQIDLIQASCKHYDSGKCEEAMHIAVPARALLHGTSNTRSLVFEYFGNRDIKLRSTTMLNMGSDSQFLGFLRLEANTGRFRPFLDDTKRNVMMPFKEWWETEPVLKLLNDDDETITRKEIILNAANAVEGTQETSTEYRRLESGLGIAIMGVTNDGRDVRIDFRNANHAVLRQIAHELLTSEELIRIAR
jgi:hypothetical protein